MAKDMGADLRWFDNGKELVEAINTTMEGGKRAGNSLISDFTFYGHGSEGALWLTYVPGNPPYGGEALMNENFPNAQNRANYDRIFGSSISPDAFAPGAKSTSWACNSAAGGSESFTQSWANSTGVPMTGLVGKSNYVPASPNYKPWFRTKPSLSPVPGNQDHNKWYWRQKSFSVTSQPQ